MSVRDYRFFKTREHFILASASPRRQRFLRDLGLDFNVRVPEISETVLPGEMPEDFVLRVSMEKVVSIARDNSSSWVLAADTAVVLGDEILGKPQDQADAMSILAKLSGRTHEVWTGFCICRGAEVASSKAVKTEVNFMELSPGLIRSYVMTGEPLDKAGAYGIQGKGGVLVEKIKRSYSNVVGLPLAEVVAELLRIVVIEPGTI